MARTFEQQLADVRTASVEELRKVLRSTKGLLIAAVAKRVGEQRIDELAEDLVAAFAPLCDDKKRDPGCRAKTAIARALHELDHWDDRVFVAGLRVTQSEGGVDTASELRGVCGLAHVHFVKPTASDVLAALLADAERNCRIAAATGFGDSGRPDATAVLRYKLLRDDEPEPEVLAACFDALFALAREASADFAIELLERDGDLAEAAVLSLGGHRVADAVKPLIAWCDRVRPVQRQRVGYVALALLRTDAGNAALLDAIRNRAHTDAVAAARALATFKDDALVLASLREAIEDIDKATRGEIETLIASR